MILEGEKSVEMQYAESLRDFIVAGKTTKMHNRTGVDTLVKSHQYFFYPVPEMNFPILKCKKIYPKLALKELLWMLQGRNDIKWLNDRHVTYWDEWKLDDGTIGKTYGYQFRNFGGVDQFNELVNETINNPESRRLIISLWNPVDLPEMALPPCQFLYQFTCVPVIKGGVPVKDSYIVDLHTLQRSGDSFLGVPYNFVYNGFFLLLFCDLCTKLSKMFSGKKKYFIADNVHHTINNYHLYENHIEQAKQYLANYDDPENRVNNDFISCMIDVPAKEATSIDAYLSYLSDNYNSEAVKIEDPIPDQYGPIKADIAV
jgi:thymidylate synthase